jgi:16S rRNA (uracil1498-N3)-methyltransferase
LNVESRPPGDAEGTPPTGGPDGREARAAAAPAWLFLPELPAPGAAARLSPEDLHYLRRVVRARPGGHVHATDGAGGVARLRVTGTGGELACETLSRTPRTRAARLLCGAPEGERGDWLVEKLAELGIAALQPVDTGRSRWDWSERRAARWQRLAIAALRQSCGRFLLALHPPLPLGAALATIPVGAQAWLADPDGEPAIGVRPGDGMTAGAAGPAAGFSDAELDELRDAGFRSLRLGEARLRSETAALAWAAWWSSAAGAFRSTS